MAHTRKRIRKLSTAVFRGSRLEYNFDVYPITTTITDNPGVFIFSRRKVDRFGRGHHTVSCVGETQSIVSEIKRHKRARCVKGNEANVVCILKEPDRGVRSGVLDDIAAARSFSCVRGSFKTTIKRESNAKTAKILQFKPAGKVESARAAVASKPASNKRGGKSAEKKNAVKSATVSNPPASKKAVKGKAPASGKRVSGGVGGDSGQHRLSKPKRFVARRAKTGAARNSRSRTKVAA